MKQNDQFKMRSYEEMAMEKSHEWNKISVLYKFEDEQRDRAK